MSDAAFEGYVSETFSTSVGVRRVHIETLYVRFASESGKARPSVLYRGLEEAVEMGCKHMRLIDHPLRYPDIALKVTEFAISRDIDIELDTPVDDVTPAVMENLKAFPGDIAILFPQDKPPNPQDLLPNGKRMNVKRLIASITIVSSSPVATASAELAEALFARGFDLLKFSILWNSYADATEYLQTVEMVNHLASTYSGKVLAMIPWVLLKRENFRVGRTVCQYKETVGLTLDGVVTCCGTDPIWAPTFSVSSRRLCEIVRDHPAFRQLREFDYTKVKGVCSQCLFSRYCANQCPAYVFNTTGAFDNSLPECQWLYEKGVFPHEFLIRKR